MNVGELLKQYFPASSNTTIDVFDARNIYDVYQRIFNVLNQYNRDRDYGAAGNELLLLRDFR